MQSAEEARKSRLDALGSDVSVGSLEPLEGRWKVVPYTQSGDHVPPGRTSPGDSYRLSGDADTRLLLGVWLRVRNEGARSVTVHIEAARVDLCNARDAISVVLDAPAAEEPGYVPTGDISLEPGEARGVIVRAGPTVKEWKEQPDRPVGIIVMACASANGPTQRWEVTLTAPLLHPAFADEDTMVVSASSPPQVVCAEGVRSYPCESSN
jgi:hypothetical protein